mgnify:CR=1 FL=1
MSVHADWLDVTYSPDNHVRSELRLFLSNLGFNCQGYETDSESWSPSDGGYGVLRSDIKHSHARISASGQILARFREIGHFDNYLALLSTSPYRITRLDAAYDLETDAAFRIAEILRKFPREMSLSRQRPLRVHSLLSARLDGLQSGTVYFGHRSDARVTARVYDKALEQFEKLNVVIPPLTRYELTFRRGLASLRDAHNPEPIFWAHIGQLLSVPSDAPEWLPSDSLGWDYVRPSLLPAEALKRRVSFSSEIEMMLKDADSLGSEGRNYLAHLILRRIGVEHREKYYQAISA